MQVEEEEQVLVQEEQEDQVVVEQVVQMVELLEQPIQVEVEVETGIVGQLVQEDQVLLLSEHQDQQDQLYLYHQELIQKQHYRHQLEDVLLRHSRFLEHLQLASNSST